jgi:hypothetical protein
MKPIDPNWSLQNDFQSVTVGINTRLWILRQQGLTPTLIRLGKEHSRLFWKERGVGFIPAGPLKLISGDVFWDEGHHCWCYSRKMIPMQFNSKGIIGIAVEGEPKPKKKSTRD